MSNKRVLLSVFAVVAIVSMATEAATAQIFSGQLLNRGSNACCAPAPAPAPTCCDSAPRVGVIQKVKARFAPAPSACCGTPAPAPAPCCGAAPAPVVAPAPVAPAPCCGGVAAAPAPAPVMVAAPVASSCCGSVVAAPMMTAPVQGSVMTVEAAPAQGVVVSDAVVETGEAIQASPSDSTVTSDIVEPPAAAAATEVAPEEDK